MTSKPFIAECLECGVKVIVESGRVPEHVVNFLVSVEHPDHTVELRFPGDGDDT